MRGVLQATVALLCVATVTASAQEESPADNDRDDRFYTEVEARDKIFGTGLVWRDTLIVVDAESQEKLNETAGYAEQDSVVRIAYVLDDSGGLKGAYRVATEVGKYNPFDFVVGVNSRFRVEGVIVLNYRESRGGDVRRQRFLSQFEGKSADSPVRLNRDIIGISGATLSSTAVTRGVKKALWWVERLWGPEGQQP